MPQVFISYATPDRVEAQAVLDELESAGWDCWIAPEDIPFGVEWPAAIYEAIREAKTFVLVFSSRTNASADVRRELHLANQRQIPVFPYLLDAAEPEPALAYYIAAIQHLHAYELGRPKALEVLKQRISAYVLPAQAPPATMRSAPAEPDDPPLPEEVWRRLLSEIANDRVIPIVGPELLEVTIAGHRVQLYSWLGERLAERLELAADDLPATGALAEVAGRWIGDGREPVHLYTTLKSLCPPGERLTLPVAFRQLAEIRALKLFATTTFDALLARALDDVRFSGRPTTKVVAYSLYQSPDAQWREDLKRTPVVFHLLGRLSALPHYALAEEDIDECLRSLSANGPRELLYELQRRTPLLLGTNLHDSATRAFLQLFRDRSLPIIVADTRLRLSTDFRKILRHSKSRPWLYPGAAAAFVEELSHRWAAYDQGEESPAVPKFRAGSIFISFPPEDRVVAEAMAVALASAGLDVTPARTLSENDFDDRVVKRAIKDASLFIPIMSRSAATPAARAFRREWRIAVEVSRARRPDLQFIVPVAIDDTSHSDDFVLPEFRKLHWVRLPEGRTDEDFIRMIRDLYRAFQKFLHQESS